MKVSVMSPVRVCTLHPLFSIKLLISSLSAIASTVVIVTVMIAMILVLRRSRRRTCQKPRWSTSSPAWLGGLPPSGESTESFCKSFIFYIVSFCSSVVCGCTVYNQCVCACVCVLSPFLCFPVVISWPISAVCRDMTKRYDWNDNQTGEKPLKHVLRFLWLTLCECLMFSLVLTSTPSGENHRRNLEADHRRRKIQR